MKKKTLFVIFLVPFSSILTACHESWGERVAREQREYTENKCPRRIDRGTVLDSVSYDVTDSVLTYYYSLTDTLDNESIFTPKIKQQFRDTIANALRGDLSTKPLKDHDITFVYQYNSAKTEKLIMRMEYTPKDYK